MKIANLSLNGDANTSRPPRGPGAYRNASSIRTVPRWFSISMLASVSTGPGSAVNPSSVSLRTSTSSAGCPSISTRVTPAPSASKPAPITVILVELDVYSTFPGVTWAIVGAALY
jgi:hypothetical protein